MRKREERVSLFLNKIKVFDVEPLEHLNLRAYKKTKQNF